jgi:DHA2 family multidrug resistance protein-like MFS transporter
MRLCNNTGRSGVRSGQSGRNAAASSIRDAAQRAARQPSLILSEFASPAGAHEPAVNWRAMSAVLLAVALATLDTAIANTALPAIAADLHASPAASVWIINAYQLAMVATLLPFASLGDIVGHKRVYIAGLAVFTLASLGCSLASTLPMLTAARIVQGFGASAIMSVNVALIRGLFPAHRLGRGVGFNALVVGVSFAVGPTIASLILSVAAWPWLFAVNVPLGMFALAVAIPSLPQTARGKHAFDPVAALFNVITFASLIFALGEFAQRGPLSIVFAAAAVALAIGWRLNRNFTPSSFEFR